MKEVEELMGLGKNYKVLKVEEEKQIKKYIYIEKTTKKATVITQLQLNY